MAAAADAATGIPPRTASVDDDAVLAPDLGAFACAVLLPDLEHVDVQRGKLCACVRVCLRGSPSTG